MICAGTLPWRLCRSLPQGTKVLPSFSKTPQHVRYAPLILKLIPGAYFIHIVRDPRSVVSSLRAAAQDWGRSWAFSGVRNNSELWHSEVSAGHQISELTPNFRELRFEDLKGERAPGILRICLHGSDSPRMLNLLTMHLKLAGLIMFAKAVREFVRTAI